MENAHLYMYVVKNANGQNICARCGKPKPLTKDHFIPKSCRMWVNEGGNYVGLCKDCNKEKDNIVVLPDWYTYLGEKPKKNLVRYMRYSRSWIREHCTDQEVLDFIEKL